MGGAKKADHLSPLLSQKLGQCIWHEVSLPQQGVTLVKPLFACQVGEAVDTSDRGEGFPGGQKTSFDVLNLAIIGRSIPQGALQTPLSVCLGKMVQAFLEGDAP